MTDSVTPAELTEQMFAAVGRAITQWSFVECDLSGLLHNILGANGWATLSMFYAVDNWRAKLQLVDAALAAMAIHSSNRDQLIAEWGRLSDKASKLAKSRNKLAHWFVRPAQRRGSGAATEPIAPARLSPPYGSPAWYRESGISSPKRSLTIVQVRHIETAFRLLSEKVRAFSSKIGSEPELIDKHVQQALDVLLSVGRLDPPLLVELRRVRSSLES